MSWVAHVQPVSTFVKLAHSQCAMRIFLGCLCRYLSVDRAARCW